MLIKWVVHGPFNNLKYHTVDNSIRSTIIGSGIKHCGKLQIVTPPPDTELVRLFITFSIIAILAYLVTETAMYSLIIQIKTH